MSDFFELINKRESCRNFSDKPVDRKLIEKCIESARLAPSACNSQPWGFVLADGEKAKEVAKCTQKGGMNKFTSDCPAFITVYEDEATLSQKIANIISRQHFAQIDVGIATAHLCLAATELGLSTCILGWFEEKKLAEILDIPEKKVIRLVIAIGYSQTDDLRTKKRKDLENIMRWVD